MMYIFETRYVKKYGVGRGGGADQKKPNKKTKIRASTLDFLVMYWGVVGWCEGAVYLTSPGRPTDIGLQLGKACYPCSG